MALVLLSGFTSAGGPNDAPGSTPGHQVAWADVKVGMCSDIGSGTVSDMVTVLDCKQAHRGEFYWVGSLPAGPFPGDSGADDAMTKVCNKYLPPGPIDWFTSFSPSQTAWEDGNRRGYCLATKEHEVLYTGSLASLWIAPWEPLYWIDGALALGMVATYLVSGARLWRKTPTVSTRAGWIRELWWFVLPVGGIVLAVVFPNGTRHYSTQSALAFPVSITLWFSMMTVIGIGLLILRALSMGRLARAARTHPGALVLEGVRLNLTLSRLRKLVDEGARTGGHVGTKLKLPFWFPVVVTESAVVITTNDGVPIKLERENIQNISGSSDFRWGTWGEAAGGEEHA
ncbi:MAG: hypothetical protein ABI130_02185 [Leifsonia sp.]